MVHFDGFTFFFFLGFFFGAKVEIGPKSFPLGVKAEIEKLFSICPKLLT